MKLGGERRKSFHHGETTQRHFPGLGNVVKRPLRGIFISFSIPCVEATTGTASSPFTRAILPHIWAFFPPFPPASFPILLLPPSHHLPCTARELGLRRQIHQPWNDGTTADSRFTAVRRRQRRQAAWGEAARPQETSGACSIIEFRFTFKADFRL
jgi:hypothetical protein